MKIENLVPEVYYKESRDFAAVGRLLQIMLNYMKTAADCVKVNPDKNSIDYTLLELVADTLGFKLRHNYSARDLLFIVSSFTELIRKKGTMESIVNAIQLLLTSQKLDRLIDCTFSEFDSKELDIKIPSNLSDTILLEDLFDYILPIGVTYRFTKIDSLSTTEPESYGVDDIQVTEVKNDIDLGGIQTSEYVIGSPTQPTGLPGTLGGNVVVSLTPNNFELISSKPENWDEEYSKYYIKKSDDNFYKNFDQIWHIDLEYYRLVYTNLVSLTASPSSKMKSSKSPTEESKTNIEFELVIEQPVDWETSYKSYYKFNDDTQQYVKNYAKTWKSDTYYKKI